MDNFKSLPYGYYLFIYLSVISIDRYVLRIELDFIL